MLEIERVEQSCGIVEDKIEAKIPRANKAAVKREEGDPEENIGASEAVY